MAGTRRGASPEIQLFDIEAKMLDAVDMAWEEYEQTGGIPPSNLLKALETAHRSIMARISKRLGFQFDPANLPAALIEVEKQRDIILKMMKQRDREELFS